MSEQGEKEILLKVLFEAYREANDRAIEIRRNLENKSMEYQSALFYVQRAWDKYEAALNPPCPQ